MDNNRLYPQPINLSKHTLGNSKGVPQKLTLRRRCRSECIQMTPNIGGQLSTNNDAKQIDNDTASPPTTNDVRRKIAQQPSFRNMLMKYSSSTILRNQDSAKNIFSSTNNRKQQQQNGLATSSSSSAVNAVSRLKNTTKENISKSTSMLNGNVNNGSIEIDSNGGNCLVQQQQSPIIIDNNNYRRELCTTRLYNGRMVRSTQDFFEKNHSPALPLPPNNLNRISSDNGGFLNAPNKPMVTQLNWKSTTALNDTNHKRRVRARSESESNELYQTTCGNNKCSPHKNHKFRGYDFLLKRSRDEDKTTTTLLSPLTYNKNCLTNKSTTELIIPATGSGDNTTKLKYTNPRHTKLINNLPPVTTAHRPNTPRYPINKQPLLNGTRKLRSRPSSAVAKSKQFQLQQQQQQQQHQAAVAAAAKKMVVSNPPRCPTPPSPSVSENKISATGEDSDTGCSSLEDDDDFDDIREGECNDSLSDSEDSFQTQNGTTTLDQKLSFLSTMTTECVVGGYATAAPLSPSLFPNVPPYITFASHEEKGPPMHPTIAKVLKWKLTTITPIVIRKVLLNTGFRLLRTDDDKKTSNYAQSDDDTDDDETNDWVGVWGKHMKSPGFKTIRSYQKINHIPGTFQIGRKDRVWRNLQVQITRHGRKEFGFMPRTYIIPSDLKMLRKIWPKYSERNAKWIIKPPASARGTGIKVVNRWSQIPKRKPLIVQRYIDRPLLINGSKFDLRLYVLITSINPLRVYMHSDGLARFASVKYSEKSDTLHDRYMHLTNYSINKLSQNYTKNEDANACKGHKWTIKSLWTHLEGQGVDVTNLWGALRNLVLRTILAGENTINQLTKINMGSKYNCYELFGIDVLLDSELIPWLLEVNISPSLHSASPLDLHVKGPLVQALLNTSMFQVPPRIPVVQQHEIMAEHGLSGPLCYDKRIYVTNLSKSERAKHTHFTQKTLINRDDYLDEILQNLTPDDLRCLLLSEDELNRSAPLERIFPSATSYKYLRFIENPRYYNRLLDAWEYRYGGSDKRQEGVELIRKLCDSKMHLSVAPLPVKKDSENSTITCNNDGSSSVDDSNSGGNQTTEEIISKNCINTAENSEINETNNIHHNNVTEFSETTNGHFNNHHHIQGDFLSSKKEIFQQHHQGDHSNGIIISSKVQ